MGVTEQDPPREPGTLSQIAAQEARHTWHTEKPPDQPGTAPLR
jgi:hypothetical protein